MKKDYSVFASACVFVCLCACLLPCISKTTETIFQIRDIILSVTRQKGISAVMPFLKFFALKTLLTKVYHHTKYDKDWMKFEEIS